MFELAVTINKEFILVVEGKCDFKVFASFGKYLGINLSLQIIWVDGEIDCPKLNAIINLPNFENKVKALGVIRDADDNPAGVFQSTIAIFDNLNLPQPSQPGSFANNSQVKTGIFIMPGDEEKGELETLIVKALENKYTERFQCVNSYLSCMQSKGVNIRKIAKAKIHSFIGGSEKPELILGEAALAGYWNWDDVVFEGIKGFLLSLTTA